MSVAERSEHPTSPAQCQDAGFCIHPTRVPNGLSNRPEALVVVWADHGEQGVDSTINRSESAAPPDNPGSAALSLTWSAPVSGGLIAIDDECNRDYASYDPEVGAWGLSTSMGASFRLRCSHRAAFNPPSDKMLFVLSPPSVSPIG